MPNFSNYPVSIRPNYRPEFKEITVSTKRLPAMVNGKRGDAVTHLQNVTSSPLILAQSEGELRTVRQLAGLEGTAVKLWQLRFFKHEHTDDGVTVDRLPDIVEKDTIVIGSINYPVVWSDTPHPLSFGQVLMVYVSEDERA